MANQEAKNLLDAIMGPDRNAPLPPGTSLPGKSGVTLQKRTKSCYDPDICPLYTAWGVDVYDLFTNTKSDLGQNPYIVDQHAHEEFMKLPKDEQENLGYKYFLFQKLQELVRQCDRVVNRNKEKLRQEINRKLGKNPDAQVEEVDEVAIDRLARSKIQAEDLQAEWDAKFKAFQEAQAKEKEGMDKLTPLLEAKTESQALDDLQMEVGKLAISKQTAVYELAQITSRLGPILEDSAIQLRHLNYVKSDIVTDKTVCEVSGNFMSSRDADERIAAHYAGKQYIGWKLVRDKLAEMQKEYGRYGPPPPARRGGPPPPDRGYHRSNSGGDRGFPPRGGRWDRGYDNRGPPRGPPPRGYRR